MNITIELTDLQEREFTACADACGMSLTRWIEECATVKAAAVIDAIQIPIRAQRNSSMLSNATINARTAVNRKKRSEVLEAARAYNAKFRNVGGS